MTSGTRSGHAYCLHPKARWWTEDPVFVDTLVGAQPLLCTSGLVESVLYILAQSSVFSTGLDELGGSHVGDWSDPHQFPARN